MTTVSITDPMRGVAAIVGYAWPPVIPTVSPTLFGSSVATRVGETQAQAWTRLSKAMTPQITRLYDNRKGLSASLTHAKSCGWPQVPTVVSCEYGADYADGRYDAEFLSAASQLSERDYWCIDHEQDAKIANAVYPAAVFLARWRYFVNLARTHAVKARAIQIFTGYKFAERAYQYVGDAWCDAIGIDPYVHNVGDTAQSRIGPILSAIRKVTAKPIGICETGSTIPGHTSYVQSLPWLRGRVAFCCWFSSVDTKTGIDYTIDATPAAAAAFRALIAA